MPIVIGNDRVAAITQAALLSGLGQYQRQQQAVQLQQQQLAQQDLQQRRGIAANMYSQQVANQQRNFDSAREMQFRAMQQQQQYAQQQAMQEQQYAQQEAMANLQNNAYMDRAEWNRKMMYQQAGMQQQFGMFKGAMDAIYDLEGKGAQYSPDQQRYVGELDAARQKASMDPNLSDEDRINADMQYWSKRSRVMPTQPPPPTKEETIGNMTQEVQGPDGSPIGAYIINNKDGVPEISFRPFPAQKDDTAKLQAAAEKQQKVDTEKQAKEVQASQKAAWDAWESVQDEIADLDDKEAKAAADGKGLGKEAIEQRKKALQKRWWDRHGKNAPPEIFEQVGITEQLEPLPDEETIDADESAFFAGDQPPASLQWLVQPQAQATPPAAQAAQAPPAPPAPAASPDGSQRVTHGVPSARFNVPPAFADQFTKFRHAIRAQGGDPAANKQRVREAVGQISATILKLEEGLGAGSPTGGVQNDPLLRSGSLDAVYTATTPGQLAKALRNYANLHGESADRLKTSKDPRSIAGRTSQAAVRDQLIQLADQIDLAAKNPRDLPSPSSEAEYSRLPAGTLWFDSQTGQVKKKG